MRLEDDVCISGIVDFDEALFGDRLYDVAATMTILKWYAEDDMMLGYKNGTALSPDEEEVVAFYVDYIVAVERFPPSIVKRFGP
jgi:Ser/Thr protein kinase RdoA (MazF antagonist)